MCYKKEWGYSADPEVEILLNTSLNLKRKLQNNVCSGLLCVMEGEELAYWYKGTPE